MKSAEEKNLKILSNLCTNYANGCWYNNQELNFNVDKAIELEDAIWDWIKKTIIPEHDKEIISKIDEMIPTVSEEDEEENYTRIDVACKLAIKYALTGLKQWIQGVAK